MAKDNPAAARNRVTRRRERLAAAGLKEVSSVIVPAEREEELRRIAKEWTEAHMAKTATDDNAH